LTFNEKNVFCNAKKAFSSVSAIAMDKREIAKKESVIAMDERERAMDERKRAKERSAIAIPMTKRAMDERERAMETAKKHILPCIRDESK
jgi:hypothetical protein